MKKITLAILVVFLTGCTTTTKNLKWYNSAEMLLYTKKASIGDIIILKKKPDLEKVFGHCSLIVDVNTVGEYCKVFIKHKSEDYVETSLKEWIYRNRNREYKIFRFKDSYYKLIVNKLKISNSYKYGKYSIFTKKSNKNKFYCSSWIWEIYKNELGVDIDSDKGVIVFPYDFIGSKYLEEIKIE